ncbi:CsbD family protein [Parvibaculum sp.]|uniref:CsbD family protein n=1 Tax=Parvibaculum sp. TaxID=2024848 RepID=UPI001B2800C4|nr:CsbD family protein [Parvibaculum sp.]MBO6677655.1 CsbD family protein [Parvibaculum sp.]MBO6684461.1 CsbD family protein [Parvibaculum sp.]
MNWDQIEGNWTQMKGKVKETWGDLTDSDLSKIEGKRDRLAGAIQARYGKEKEDAEKEIDNWLSRH